MFSLRTLITIQCGFMISTRQSYMFREHSVLPLLVVESHFYVICPTLSNSLWMFSLQAIVWSVLIGLNSSHRGIDRLRSCHIPYLFDYLACRTDVVTLSDWTFFNVRHELLSVQLGNEWYRLKVAHNKVELMLINGSYQVETVTDKLSGRTWTKLFGR